MLTTNHQEQNKAKTRENDELQAIKFTKEDHKKEELKKIFEANRVEQI